MSLAHSLNELAAAHDRNLISDDDYRILRQDLFRRSTAPEPHPTPQQQPQPPPPPPPPLQHKKSVVFNVASLFRRATGRSTRKQDSPPHPCKPSKQPCDDEQQPATLRTDLATLEAERNRLLDAFASLESSTLKRIQYKTARRLYTPTPANVNVVLQGHDWRRPTKPVPSIVLPPRTPRLHHPNPSMSSSRSDQLSLHSTDSSRLSLSQPPHSPRFRNTLQRQNSISSASTHSTGTSSRLAAMGPRSTGNIYLASLTERSSSSSKHTIADSRMDDDDLDNDDDPEAKDYASALQELDDIRRRRDEVDARYLAKLEYIKAKLRAAELHEHVSRR
ncbi:hypothetical protein AGABI1DRAFT_128872 [Agaricus bisporus var. burnettii JB137-S8]|uniref:Uncharacterized protein n=1 Tax=Agaricus bisporus var. burnettii (strain JB137-S8 / ATCC MYA-4627 / FGSC 10392) TaxID=597362 RepID=K5VVW3_AGABU|nr:uncharacterized protein AGABI1DRAFT_128872 [Agaricus bisporus var. burnettii JB137-S8]EKM78584.1 hypothetical protein AGABI1DRAFT_128872 [Agaricus bisporus var. burnettii JB137-S8]